jgi:hypothetical protein
VAGAVPISACKNILGKAAALHLILTLFCGWDVWNSAYRTLGTAVLMSSSHRLLIIHSPYLVILLKGHRKVIFLKCGLLTFALR